MLQTLFSVLNSWLGTAVNKISSISGFSFTTNNDINYYTLFAWIALHIYPYLMYLLVLTIGFLFKKIRLEINQLVGCCKLQYVLGKKECSVCVEISVDKNIRWKFSLQNASIAQEVNWNITSFSTSSKARIQTIYCFKGWIHLVSLNFMDRLYRFFAKLMAKM